MYKGVNILTAFDMWDNMWCFRTVRFVSFSVAVVLAVVLCISFQLLRTFLLQVLYFLSFFFSFFFSLLFFFSFFFLLLLFEVSSCCSRKEFLFFVFRDCCILEHDQTL